MLGCRTPFSFCFCISFKLSPALYLYLKGCLQSKQTNKQKTCLEPYTTFLSSMHSREQGPQSSVCTPVQHTLWLDQLYCFILVSLVVVFVAVYNATNILNQWRHLALTSELPVANSSITFETFWAASTNHRARKVPGDREIENRENWHHESPLLRRAALKIASLVTWWQAESPG